MEKNEKKERIKVTVIKGGNAQNENKNLNDCEIYEVGDRIIFYTNDTKEGANWVVEKVNGKRITLKQLILLNEVKTYNLAYLNKLSNERLVEKKERMGKSRYLSEFQKEEILKLPIFNKKAIDYIEDIALIGAEECDWKLVCDPGVATKEQFKEFMKIIEMSN